MYDASAKRWKQFWVDNAGAVLEFTGVFRADTLAYTASTIDSTGTTTIHRLTFFPMSRDSVRQLWEQSTNASVSWSVAFDGRYVRMR